LTNDQQPRQRAPRGQRIAAAGLIALAAAALGLYASSRIHAAAPSPPASPETVAYQVDGGPANVSYGPAGSSLAGSAPMRQGGPLGTPAYYYIWAQLQGDGSVSCQISVDGAVVSRAVASAAYGVAHCEIVRSLATGQWTDANGA
jgi:hypothetical protein